MKKNILFVIPTLDLGGAEKSLVNLLNSLDYSQYEVDLFLFLKQGVFLESLPKEVNVLNESENFRLFSQRFYISIFSFLIRGKIKLAIYRLILAGKYRFNVNNAENEQFTWDYLQSFFPEIHKNYDVVIGYLEKSSIYFIIEKTKSKNKFGWIHTDLSELGLNLNFESKYLFALDKIIIVSEDLKKRLSELIPYIENKIYVIENITSRELIKVKAQSSEKLFSKKEFNVVYVGRLAEVKNLTLAVDAIKIIRKEKIPIHLHLIGDGILKKELENYIISNELNDCITLHGIKNNPYVFINQSDCFILCSKYEGKSIALEEAKILLKPIVVTNFASAKDQIKNNETGLIAEMNAESIAEKLLSLYNDNSLQEKLIANLKKEKLGNENEVEKLYHLINL